MKLIYEGKAKKVFSIEGHANQVLMEFKDSLTAFNAQKLGSFEGKGSLNRDMASLVFKYLAKEGVRSHFLENVGETGMKAERVTIIPLEVVVRNRVAGGLAKKLGREEGELLKRPLVEFYYKSDSLGDPFLSEDQAEVFGFATQEEMSELKRQALQVNAALSKLFNEIGIDLIDFKIEFGKTHEGRILLADEVTPDTCRLWDQKTGEKMDKDRFRRDLGDISHYYNEVLERLFKKIGGLK